MQIIVSKILVNAVLRALKDISQEQIDTVKALDVKGKAEKVAELQQRLDKAPSEARAFSNHWVKVEPQEGGNNVAITIGDDLIFDLISPLLDLLRLGAQSFRVLAEFGVLDRFKTAFKALSKANKRFEAPKAKKG